MLLWFLSKCYMGTHIMMMNIVLKTIIRHHPFVSSRKYEKKDKI